MQAVQFKKWLRCSSLKRASESAINLFSVTLLILTSVFSLYTLSVQLPRMGEPELLSFRVVETEGSDQSFERLAEVLKQSPQTEFFSNRLFHQWYAVGISGSHSSSQNLNRLVLESEHVMQVQCQATQFAFSGRWWVAKRTSVPYSGDICLLRMVGPGSLQVAWMNDQSLERHFTSAISQMNFLQGSFISLMILALLSALVSGKKIFLIYALWLLASLRMCLMSSGVDVYLFGFQIDHAWLPEVRKISLVMYIATTFGLAMFLFPNARRDFWRPFRTIILASICLLFVLAPFGSYALFLQVMWPLSLFAALVTLAVAGQAFVEQRSLPVVLYLLGISILLTGSLGELLSAWLDWELMQRLINSQTTALLSSWMLVISVLEAQRAARNDRRRAELKVQQMHQRMSTIFEMAPAPMFSVTENGQIDTVNSSFSRIESQLDSPAFLRPAFLSHIWEQLQINKETWSAQYRHVSSSMQPSWYELNLVVNGREMIGCLRDMTEEKDRESLLQYQATHDELTGALNRRGLDERLKFYQLSGVQKIELVLIDIKRFQHLVKAHGLPVADRILVKLFHLIQRYLGEHGDLVRHGYDQFVVVHVKSERSIEFHFSLDRLLQSLRLHALHVDGLHAFVQIQVGVVQMPIDPVERSLLGVVEDLINEVKFRIRPLKEERKVFDAEQSRQFLQHVLMGEQISAHGLPGNLVLQWQPVLNIQGQNACLYAESLLRQRSSTGRVDKAESVLQACHNRGRTALLDLWVLKQTLKFVGDHLDELRNLKVVGVNISPLSLNDESFISDVLVTLEENPLAAKKICLEVTEMGTVLNPVSVKSFISKARQLGVTIGLDDFGSGVSNFQFVLDLSADVIKIDGSIASQVCQNLESRSVVGSIVNLARDLGCLTVAECVEDRYTLDELCELGVDFVQGYLVSPAVDPTEFLGRKGSADFFTL